MEVDLFVSGVCMFPLLACDNIPLHDKFWETETYEGRLGYEDDGIDFFTLGAVLFRSLM